MTTTKSKKSKSPLNWRVEEGKENDNISSSSSSSTSKRSHHVVVAGIDPKQFHSSFRKMGQEHVQELHRQTQDQLFRRQYQTVQQELEIKRAAFRQITSLHTWPIQSRALEHYYSLITMDGINGITTSDSSYYLHDPEDDRDGTVSDHYSVSSASATSSTVSEIQPKRGKHATCSLKDEFRREFLRQVEPPGNRSSTTTELPDLTKESSSFLWNREIRIFSYERSKRGSRKYVTGHFGRIVDHYWRRKDPTSRHYYELIPIHTPCRLYLDIEFNLDSNQEISPVREALMDELWLELQAEIQCQFPNIGKVERSHLVDLDSSTTAKFSRHWILHTRCLFTDNAAVGTFVHNFISRLATAKANRSLETSDRPLLQKYLFVNPPASGRNQQQQQCLIDLGVYTRNRLFRLLGSSKYGKPPSAALRIADRNAFPFPPGFTNASFYMPEVVRPQQSQDESLSLFTQLTSLEKEDDINKAVRERTDWELHAQALAETLVVPLGAANYELLSSPAIDLESESNGAQSTTSLSISEPGPLSQSKQDFVPRARYLGKHLSYGTSPYSQIDDFVSTELANRGGTQGFIRAWSIDRDNTGKPLYLTFQMSRNRWCENIQREHKSNNVMWIIDMVRFHCSQGCHDPDCRLSGFRGEPIDLPEYIVDGVKDQILEEQLAVFDGTNVRRDKPLLDDSEFEAALSTLDLGSLSIRDIGRKLSPIKSARESLESHESGRVNKEDTESCAVSFRPNSNETEHEPLPAEEHSDRTGPYSRDVKTDENSSEYDSEEERFLAKLGF